MQRFWNKKLGMVTLAGITSVLLAGQAWAASKITFDVALSELNQAYVNAWKTPPRMLMPTGNTADNQQYVRETQVTWQVLVAVDPNGVHEQPGHPSNGYKPWGAANLVVNLELREGTANGPLVSDALFYSAINNGQNGDPSAAAAFAVNYNIVPMWGPGRAIDQLNDATPPNGGPNMGIFTYPTAEPGTLLGMGCGYTLWNRSSGTAILTSFGVGLVTVPSGAAGLGTGPVFEGQIDTTNLDPGLYVLRCIPGAGNNVLRGDVALTSNQNAFAVAANQTVGRDIVFEVLPHDPCITPVILSAVSRKTHGAIGDFDIDLPLDGSPVSECRIGGPTKIVVTFDKDVAAADGTLDIGSEVVASAGTIDSATITGAVLEIDLSGVPDEACAAITLNGIKCAVGVDGIIPATTLRVQALYGDVNADGQVASGDITQVKSVSGQVTGAGNFRRDVNADGQVASGDITVVKARSGNVAGICP